jgi:hypothetical protein
MNHIHNPRPVASCLTCLYFRQLEMGSGSCHRYPPSFAGDTSPKESHHWKFPVVGGHSWCGEHRALPERPQSPQE